MIENSNGKKIAKKRDCSTSIDESVIANYLISHSDFFIRNPEVLDYISIPHPVKGTISLIEAQQKRLKSQIDKLQFEMKSSTEIYAYNNSLFKILFGIYNKLYQCSSIDEIVELLNITCRESLYVPYANLLLNSAKLECVIQSDKKYQIPVDTFSVICNDIMNGKRCDLGKITVPEKNLIFNEDELVYSRALVRLGRGNGDMGILIFGHADINHYRDGLDTSFIEQLAGYISLLIPRFAKMIG